MSAPVDVLAVLDRCVDSARVNAKSMLGNDLGTEAISIYGDLNAARSAVAELIEALAEARAYVRMCTPAPDLPAEAWGRVMDRTGAALARCKGGAA
jgi:hypothetical protein